MGGTWECRDVNVEFREKIGSRVLFPRLGQYGVYWPPRDTIGPHVHDTLSHSKANCGRGGTRGNGINSRSKLFVFVRRLLIHAPRTVHFNCTIYTITLSVPQPVPQPICKQVISPFCLEAAVNQKRPVYPLFITRPAAATRVDPATASKDYDPCCARARRSCSSISLSNRHCLSLNYNDKNELLTMLPTDSPAWVKVLLVLFQS